jgi:hypothetical protein
VPEFHIHFEKVKVYGDFHENDKWWCQYVPGKSISVLILVLLGIFFIYYPVLRNRGKLHCSQSGVQRSQVARVLASI